MRPVAGDDVRRLPAAGDNNLWYRRTSSGRVIVFVHGVLSDSRNCWLSDEAPSGGYWPKIVGDDVRFESFGIFLGGYYTAVDAGRYEIRNSADELLSALQRVDEAGNAPVISNHEIIFVCHSTGGIVVRYILVHHTDLFRDKKIGLVLIASPSLGSTWANWAGMLTSLYGHAVGSQLKARSWSVRELDAAFKRLREENRIPSLCGVEAYENHFILHRKWVPNKLVIVTEESAGRYFGPPVLLRKTDHFTSVKPESAKEPAHELLVDFCQKHFGAIASRSENRSPIVEYVYRDDVRLDSYLSQIARRQKVPLAPHEKIQMLVDELTRRGHLLRSRPGSANFSESAFVLESISATKVIFPRKLTKANDLPQIAVWVAQPTEPPILDEDSELDARGTFLYLIQIGPEPGGHGEGFSWMGSGRSALEMVLRDLEQMGSVQESASNQRIAYQNFSFPLAVLKECGGLVQQARRITTLYKPRSMSDEQYVQVSGKIVRCFDLYAYPIFISVS